MKKRTGGDSNSLMYDGTTLTATTSFLRPIRSNRQRSLTTALPVRPQMRGQGTLSTNKQLNNNHLTNNKENMTCPLMSMSAPACSDVDAYRCRCSLWLLSLHRGAGCESLYILSLVLQWWAMRSPFSFFPDFEKRNERINALKTLQGLSTLRYLCRLFLSSRWYGKMSKNMFCSEPSGIKPDASEGMGTKELATNL